MALGLGVVLAQSLVLFTIMKFAGAIPLQLATLGKVFLMIALVSDSVGALAAGTARHWFARSPRRISTLSTTGGMIMIGLGGTLALAGNKS